ncbi:MAG: flagellar hook-associated family protein [Rhizobiaceae bacterium]|nr:flagellar hook-associated family protein [Rhizobiaceae bacterium]
MKTTFISSYNTNQAVRTHLMKMQAELVKVEREVVTGRVADAGLKLGSRTGHSISLQRDVERLSGIIDSNSLASSRLSAIQHGLQSLSDLSQTFLSTMTAAVSGSVSPSIAKTEAISAITTITGVLNSSMNGENLFAGINTDVTPINDFFATGSPARTAMEAAFATHFGFAYNSAAADGVDAAAMENFLTTVIEPQFMGADWTTNWSNASDETITARISMNETASASVSANFEGARRVMMAAASVAVFFDGSLNANALNSVVEHAASMTARGVSAIGQEQAKTGIVEQRITNASERLQMQINIFEGKISDLEGVDAYEASTRVSTLLAQIETAYTLTSRIRQLSLVRYLP